ncbi:uncharacterized protein LOC5505799 [Nematostella vectensis]|nr:uncharacterized protein LOC5505799 [Nematostella vectensis]
MRNLQDRLIGRELHPEELSHSEEGIIRLAQCQAFTEEYKALATGKQLPSKSLLAMLCPRLDEQEVIRCDGRLHFADELTYDISDRYWIIAACEEIREWEHECNKCRKQKNETATQTAVHLEVSWGLDTDSFLRALNRFTNRRGLPKEIVSDNGTNCVGAVNEFQELVGQIDTDNVMLATAQKGIKWRFNPPGAPHFVGAHEIIVKAANTPSTQRLEMMSQIKSWLLFMRGRFAPETVDTAAYNPRNRWRKVHAIISKEFSGNSDDTTVVQNDVNPPIIGWYVRLHPVKWHSHPAMRVEMYGCLSVPKGIRTIENLGCFKSKGPNTTLPSLENIDPALQWSYQQRAGAILRCADAAFRRGYEVFGIQDGGKCVAGGMSDYGGNGGSIECVDNGRGANGANEVYRIDRECAWGHELCTWTSKGGNGTWVFANVTDISDAPKGGDDNGVETAILSSQKQFHTQLPINMTAAITLCYWVMCNPSRLEVAMETHDGNTVIGFTQRHCALQLKVLGNKISYDNCVCNKIWRHVCVTWKSHAGVWEIYLDGQVIGFGRLLSARLTLPDTTHFSIFHDAFNSSSPTKLTGLSAWGHVIVPEEIMRMSYGCGDVKGDIMNWGSLFKLMRGSYRTERQADCRIAKGGMLLNISSTASVLSSPWFNRSGSEYESCMRFRYLATGRRTARLVVSLRVEGDPMGERPVWGVGGDDGSAWRYGQVVIGTVTRYQVSFQAASVDHSSMFALGGVWFSSGYCATTPLTAASACNEHFTAPYGNITSPNYPGYYPRDTKCEWRITAPVDHVIRITFRTFQLPELPRCAGDYLELHDGIPSASHKSSVIGRFCGNYYPPVVESSANRMAVVFKSSSSAVPASGFWLYYEVFENKDAKSCSGNTAECPASCTCYQSSGNIPRFVVEGRLLSAVPRDIPEYTAVLLLKGNRINEVKKSDFASLPLLEYIDLSGNIILRLLDGAFSNLPSIKDM